MKESKIINTRMISKYFPPTVSKENIDWNDFAEKYDEVQRLMKEKHLWFESGHSYYFRPAIHKKIILGRMQYYIQFSDFMYEKYNQRYYLLDLMTRLYDVNDTNTNNQLLYYILDAEEIHVNLEGVSNRVLRNATINSNGLLESKQEIPSIHTTAWEINQVFHRNNLLDITYFHTGGSLNRRQVYRSLGKNVPINRILNDNKSIVKNYMKEIGKLDKEILYCLEDGIE